MDDVLQTESFGVATFDGSGRWLAYTRIPPYESLTDYSIHFASVAGIGGRQVWIADTQTEGEGFLLGDQGLDVTQYVQEFSPDGESLVVVRYKAGDWTLASCGIKSNVCSSFPGMPDILDGYVRIDPNSRNIHWNARAARLVWTSDQTFVFPMRDGEVPNSEMRNRVAVGRMLWQKWNDAWKGKTATALVARSTGKDTSDEWDTGSLVEMNVQTGGWRKLADGRFAGATPSKDGRWLAVARLGMRERPLSTARYDPQGLDALTITHPVFDRRNAPYLIDPVTGEMRSIPGPFNVDPTSFVWSDEGRLSMYGWEKGEGPESGRYYVVDIESGTLTNPVRRGVRLANRGNNLDRAVMSVAGPARASFMGDGLVVFAKPDEAQRYDWYLFSATGMVNLSKGIPSPSHIPVYADSRSMVIYGSNGIYRLSPDRPPRLMHGQADGAASIRYEDLSYPSDARRGYEKRMVILGKSSEAQQVLYLDFDRVGDPVESRVIEAKGGSVIAASHASKQVLYERRDGPVSALTLEGPGGDMRELARINSHLNAIREVRVEKIRYQLDGGSNGLPPRDTEACLFLPDDYEPGRRYPLVVEVYPSPTGSSSCTTFHQQPVVGSTVKDLWATRGVIYMRPPVPLNYARTSKGPIAALDSVLKSAIDAAVGGGFVDPDRVVLFGMSQGGISSLYVAAKSDIYKGVISMFGWADFYSHYFEGRGLYRYFHLDQNGGDNRWRYECVEPGEHNYCPFGFGLPPLDNPAPYVEESPVRMAGSFTAPVLLVHSDLDYFGMNQFDMMFGALYRAGKEATYIRYLGEGHGASSPANIRDLWARIDDFLLENEIIE